MKKSLLLSFLAPVALLAGAQDKPTATVYSPQSQLNPLMAVSANGRYLAGGQNVGVTLIDLQEGTEEVRIDSILSVSDDGTTQEYFYDVSAASGVTNDGMIVGTYGYDNSAPAAILKKGAAEWEYLPVPPGFSTNNCAANGVTPDGKYIIGYGASNKGGCIYVPLLWTLQDNGSYTVEELPYPTTDIWGSSPQYVVAFGISDDGSCAYGKLVDFTGYCTLGVVFKKGADGVWTSQTIGEDWVIIGDTNPGPQPQFEDYVTAEEGTAEYWQQVNDFEWLVFDWWPLAEAYARLSSSPSGQILVNQNSVSPNGKYVVISTPDGEGRVYNTGDMTYEIISSRGCSATSVTDNGDVFFTYSSLGYASGYVATAGNYTAGLTALTSWLGEYFSVTYDDSYVGGLGVCNMSSNGKVIVGFSRKNEVEYITSYVVLSEPAGVNDVVAGRQPYVADGMLYIADAKAQVSLYNTTGSRLATFVAGSTTDLRSYARGLVIVKVATDKGVRTFKVVL